VKGARAYYLRTVLHDWPDKQVLQILARVREAMTSDSLLLINEMILPESNVALSSATADLMMMVSFASLERTQQQFETLLDKAGLQLVKVWTRPDSRPVRRRWRNRLACWKPDSMTGLRGRSLASDRPASKAIWSASIGLVIRGGWFRLPLAPRTQDRRYQSESRPLDSWAVRSNLLEPLL